VYRKRDRLARGVRVDTVEVAAALEQQTDLSVRITPSRASQAARISGRFEAATHADLLADLVAWSNLGLVLEETDHGGTKAIVLTSRGRPVDTGDSALVRKRKSFTCGVRP
jgi:hypothetical protein